MFVKKEKIYRVIEYFDYLIEGYLQKSKEEEFYKGVILGLTIAKDCYVKFWELDKR